LAGAILWTTARYQLGEAFSVFPKAKKIVQTGIYKKIRHPIYTSGIITIFGLCLVYQKLWINLVLLALIIMQVIRAKAEEKILTNKFRQEYISYKKSTWF
jgi:protein-S-isoprenylcysteine O-methyltransferase Ste14